MPHFTVQIRAIRHLTSELLIEADSEDAAREEAQSRFRMPGIEWSESEPEDEQIESIELED